MIGKVISREWQECKMESSEICFMLFLFIEFFVGSDKVVFICCSQNVETATSALLQLTVSVIIVISVMRDLQNVLFYNDNPFSSFLTYLENNFK